MISLSKYRLAFLAGFVIIPGVIWAVEFSPTLTDRADYLARQENAKTVQARNRLLPTQRDELKATWEEFKPNVAIELGDLGNDLNPHLVQKRLHSIAASLGCSIVVQPMATQDEDFSVRFTIAGEGSYQGLVKLVDTLEQGQHFVRFEKLMLTMPNRARTTGGSGSKVQLSGTVMIPLMPAGVE